MSGFHTCPTVVVGLLVVLKASSPCDDRMTILISLNLLVKNAVQNCFLCKTIDISRGLRLLRQNNSGRPDCAIM